VLVEEAVEVLAALLVVHGVVGVVVVEAPSITDNSPHPIWGQPK
jgi:hypothetical protein